MTVSMRVMSAGAGYRYLLSSVVAGDGARPASTPLTTYYTQHGTPPGRWLGTGLRHLGDAGVAVGDVVTEAQLERLLGHGCDPVTGDPLGHAFPHYPTRQERIDARIANLDPELPADVRAVAVARIEAEEAEKPQRRAVAGYDLTFSAPKSVSILWGLAPPAVREQIIAAHHAAIADVLTLVEDQVAATRTGAAVAGEGAVAQVEVEGIIAAAFDHYDSRGGDPQLHAHVVISNKVRTVLDGRWRSLDGRPLHAAVVALSEHYNAVLADRLTATLGVQWEQRPRERDRNPAWEITGIPDQLIEEFSSRASAIEQTKEQLIATYVATHGHQPSVSTVIRLRQQATLQTRPDKTLHCLDDLTRRWRTQAQTILGADPQTWADALCRPTPGVQPHDAGRVDVDQLARRVLQAVADRRSTWRRWNVHAETSRQLMGTRFATTAARDTAVAAVIAAVERTSVVLTPPELASVPSALRRSDGTSVLRPRHATVFTSRDLLDAEHRLLERSRNRNGPTVPVHTVGHTASTNGKRLGEDQAAALVAVATSGRIVDVLIGPAGTGKTTTMRALRSAWEHLYGPGSVVGLAPSAAAAEVLGAELGIVTENTAKWLHDHRHGNGSGVRAGQLIIIDEASLAGTHTLDAISGAAATAGARVLLVGDWAQLAAVDAGGALHLLATDRPDVAELSDVRRFHHPWEADASLQLRNGNPTVIDTLTRHDRIRDGDTDTMIQAAFTGWRTDRAAGRSSLLIAASRDTTTVLNQRARADRITNGHVDPAQAVRLHDRTLAGVGDVIVTRRNNRHLQAGRRWVRNGDRWTITGLHPDGSLTVQRTDGHGQTMLPAGYVAAHVELGYAVTAHRAQGATVDTVHAVIDPTMTRESLYVALTRGRHANTAYTCTDTPEAEPHQHTDPPSARSVLTGVLQRVGAEPSAHQAMRQEQDRWASIAQLAAEYETITAAAQHDRWTRLIRQSGLTDQQAGQVLASPALGPLTAALRRAEAHHHTPEQLLPRLVAARPLTDADDIAAVLHHRVTTATTRPGRGGPAPKPARLIVGLIPAADGPMQPDMREALDQRQHLIQQRARTLVATAVTDREPWLQQLGPPPADVHHRRQWLHAVQTIAAYRDRHHITSHTPLGDNPPTDGTRPDAATALRAARTAAQHRRPPTPTFSQDLRRAPSRADGLSR